jgi:hypothetical protein
MTTKAHILTTLTLASPLLLAQAQTNQTTAATPPPSPALSSAEQTIKDLKNPVSWLSWGTDLRIRDEHFDNILTLSPNAARHEQDYLRFRARIWASVTPFEDLSFNVRLANESREWLKPAGYTVYSPHSGLDMRDGIFDNLNVQWRNILQQPLTATVGRQDILLGDGWLVGDGSPFDGSWTYFLDAARLTYELKDQHTTIDAIGIVQDAHDNGWLETVNADQNLTETEQNEKGAILWVANKSIPAANLDGYFIYKHDNAINDFAFGTANGKHFRPDNADIYTVGGRLSGLVAEHWKYSAEGAYQFGRKQDPAIQYPSSSLAFHDIDAFGFNSKLAYLFKDKLNNQLNVSYEFLSGDNPGTGNDEMFDNLWGRWPRWSEIGLYSYAAETRIGNEANLHRVGPGWSFTPVKDLDFSAAYYALFAAEGVATRGVNSLFAGNSDLADHGTFRGHFLQAIVKYKLSKHVSAHLWSEFQFPGDYYVNRTTWYFLRPEIMFTF